MKPLHFIVFCFVGSVVSAPVSATIETSPTILASSSLDLDQRIVVLPIGTGGLRFLEVRATGTGCPPLANDAHSWEANTSPDGQTLTIMFRQYEADVGYGAASAAKFVMKYCTIGVTVHVPNGFTYAVQAFDYGGYVYVDPNIRASLRADYYFQGDQVHSVQGDTVMWGPQDRDYVLHDDVPIGALVWAPCGVSRDLNIKTGLTLLNKSDDPHAYGYINTAVMYSRFVLTVNFAWATC